MSKPRSNRVRLCVLAAILLLGFGLRICRLGTQSLWYDETVSVYLAGQPIAALLAHTAGDIHPPGYYLLLHGWTQLAGASDFAAAFLSAFFGLLLVALAYRLADRVFGATSAPLAALLVAASPYNLWYSQEVRMYTLGAALGLGVLWPVLTLLAARPRRLPGWWRLASYTVCGALGLWVLYYFAFLLVAVNAMVVVWWLVRWRRRRVRWAWLLRWALAQGAVLLLYAPWLPVASRQAVSPPVPPWRGFTPLGKLLVETWSALSLGQSVRPEQVWPVLLLVAVLFALGLAPPVRRFSSLARAAASRRRRGSEPALPWLLAGYVFLPVLLIYAASFGAPLYHVRYVFTYSTPFYVVIAAGLAWLWRRWRPAPGLALVVLLVSSSVSIYAYHTNPRYASDDHREAVAFLAANWRPGDAILVNAGYAYSALLTYWQGDPIAWRGRLVGEGQANFPAAPAGPVVLQAGTVDGPSSLGWGDPQSDFYAMSSTDAAAALSHVFAAFNRVWVYRIYDTVTDPTALIRRWLSEHGTQFEDQVFSGESQLRVQGLLTGRPALAGANKPVDALADGSLTLLESTYQTAASVGSALDISFLWRATTVPSDQRILFAGLYDDAGQRWAQTDERPMGSLYPVATWPDGATIRTPLRIWVPAGTPIGRYRLEVGWYRFEDAQPIWLPWTSGDRWPMGEVEVTAPADWWAVPLPATQQRLGVSIGHSLRLVGITAQALEVRPGDALDIELVWQALADKPEPGLAVLLLVDDAGRVLAQAQAAAAGGTLPFVQMAGGQTVLDRRSLAVPAGVAPGTYSLVLGRLSAAGSWLPVHRGPVALGRTCPLATVRVLERTEE